MIGVEITKAGFEGTSTSRKQDKNGISFFKYPYAILVSRILDYFGVDTQE